MNSTNISQVRKDRHGANNPMWGRKHSDEARRKQSEAAQKRNQEFQKWKAANRPLTMDEFLKFFCYKGYTSTFLRNKNVFDNNLYLTIQ